MSKARVTSTSPVWAPTRSWSGTPLHNKSPNLISPKLNGPGGLATDGAGNVFIADVGNNAIKEWNATTGQVITLVSSGLDGPRDVAVDAIGNVFIADSGNGAIKEWNATTGQVITLVSELANPSGVAVDAAGNVYIANTYNGSIEKWNASTGLVTIVVSGLTAPSAVAVDGAGNLYFSDGGAIEEWNATTHLVTNLVPAGLYNPNDLAVDAAGNVFIADYDNGAIEKWSVTTNQVTTLVPGLNGPGGVAIDGAGNVYFADTGNNSIGELVKAYVPGGPVSEAAAAGSDALTAVVPALPLTGAFAPSSDQSWLTIGAVDNGVVHFSFTANSTAIPRTAHITLLGRQIYVTQAAGGAALGSYAALEGPAAGSDAENVITAGAWTASSNASWLHTSASGNGSGVASFTFDANTGPTRTGTLTIAGFTLSVTQAGSGYVAANPVITLASASLANPASVALDSAGNVYLADPTNNTIQKWNATTHQLTVLVSSGLSSPFGVAVDSAGNVYIADTGHNAIKEWRVSTQTVTTLVSSGLSGPEGVDVDAAGNVYIADTGHSAIKEWRVSNRTVTTLASSGLNRPDGVAVDGAGNVYIADTGNNAIEKWNATSGLTTLVSGLNGPTGVAVDGFGNVYIADNGNGVIVEWNASAQQATTLIYSGLKSPQDVAVDGAGNIFIVGLGSNALVEWSASTQQATTLISPKLNSPSGMAVDAAGNLYFADYYNDTIEKWNSTTQQLTTVVSSGLFDPEDVAVDAAGNLYIADSGNNAIKMWSPTTGQLTTLVSSGLNDPFGVTVDGAGNVFIADTFNGAIKKWNPTTGQVTTLASGLTSPFGVTVDGAGNLYFSDYNDNTLKKWSATTHLVTTLVSSGLNGPSDVAVDAVGNIYIADIFNNAIKKWNATTHLVATLLSGLNGPDGVAVDGLGNVYFADTNNRAIDERFNAYVPGGPVDETAAAGSDALAAVVPATLSLTGAFAPSSDQSWLTIGAVDNGVVHFSFTANTGAAARTAHITLLGQQITVTQEIVPVLGSYAGLEGPAAGSDTDIVIASGAWTATSNAPWLHTSASGTGNGLASFTFDANSGATRTGTLTIAGLTLTVTQAGSSYVAANPVISVASTGLNAPRGVAVDGSGNIYFADTTNNAIKKWNATTQQVTTLVSAGLTGPIGVAVDGAGNVYFSDTGHNSIKEWIATTQLVTTLVSSGLTSPNGIGLDTAGNVYIADTGHNSIKEWNATTKAVTTLVSTGLTSPAGVAVDAAGNVFIADTGHNAIKEWNVTTKAVTSLVSTGLTSPDGVAVDGSGNVYIADTSHNAVKVLKATTGLVTTLASTGLSGPFDVAVDGAGNLYIADTGHNAIDELLNAYVPGSQVNEPFATGSDALAAIIPTTQALTGSFAPSSDQSWLTIGANANGVVNFAFTANLGAAARTAHISLLGQQIAVTQAARPNATINISPYTSSGTTYDGASHTATGTASGVGGVDLSSGLILTGTTHTNAGTYTDSWSFHDPSGNYQDASGTITDSIAKAFSATITIGAGPFTYTGSAQVGGSGTVSGAGGLNTSATSLTYSAASAGTGVADQIDAGTYYVTAHFAGDMNHLPSDGAAVPIVINKATTMTTTFGAPPFTYDGTFHIAGSGTVIGTDGFTTSATLTYSANPDGTGFADQVDAGTYYVTAHFAGDMNHLPSDGAAVPIVINKATTMTTTFGAPPFTYDGTFHIAGSGTVIGTDGFTTSATLTYSANPDGTGFADQVDAGTYYVTAHFAGDMNHLPSDGAAVPIVINKATTMTTTFGAGPFTYDGSSHMAGSGTVIGSDGFTTSASLTYSANPDGTGFANQIDAGTYYVTAHYAGDMNHLPSDGAAVPIVINKASTMTTTFGAPPFTYDGSFHIAGSGTVIGSDGFTSSATLTYSANPDGSGFADQIDAGTYYVTAHFAGDMNHLPSDGAAVPIVINKATTMTTTFGAPPFTYDGSFHIAGSGTVIGSDGFTTSATLTYSANADGTGAPDFIDAGTYYVTAHFAGDINHTASDGAAVSIVINKARASITVTAFSVTYNGNVHAATGAATGVGGVDLSAGLNLSGTAHTNAGAYNGDAWSFHDASGNYLDDSGTVDDSIAKATASITVTPYSITYDGQPHTATGTAAGVGGVILSGGLTLSGTTHSNAGVYGSDAWSFSGGTNYFDANGAISDSIAKAPTTTTVTIVGGPFAWTGGPVTPATITVTGAGGLSLTPMANYANNVNIGLATASYSYAGDTNHLASSDSKNFAIGPVLPVVVSPTATKITSTLATLGGDVTSSGGMPLLKRGVLYAPTPSHANLMLGSTGVIEVDATSTATGVLTQDLTGLLPNTAYSFVAFATNSQGTSYSPAGTFTTTILGPLSSISGPTSGQPGQLLTFILNGYDPAPGMQLNGFVFRIKWGDGKTDAVTGLNGTTINHTYVSAGTYAIQVTATDGRGSTLPTGTWTVVISSSTTPNANLTGGGPGAKLTPAAGVSTLVAAANSTSNKTTTPSAVASSSNAGSTAVIHSFSESTGPSATASPAQATTVLDAVLAEWLASHKSDSNSMDYAASGSPGFDPGGSGGLFGG